MKSLLAKPPYKHNPISEAPVLSLGKLHLLEARRSAYSVKLTFGISRKRVHRSGDLLYFELNPDVEDLKEFLDRLRGLAGIEKRPGNPGITNAQVIRSHAKALEYHAAMLREAVPK